MKHQQGAALVIVMVLLSGALMLGMSGMQSALIDERLAGNYRALVQANMNAESAYSKAVEENIGSIDWGGKTYTQDDIEKMKWQEINNLGQIIDQCEDEKAVCFYFPLIVDGRKCLVAFGALSADQEAPLVVSNTYFLFLE